MQRSDMKRTQFRRLLLENSECRTERSLGAGSAALQSRPNALCSRADKYARSTASKTLRQSLHPTRIGCMPMRHERPKIRKILGVATMTRFFEQLEDRNLLAQTPQLLFDLKFSANGTLRSQSLSEVYRIQDEFVAIESVMGESFSLRSVILGEQERTHRPAPFVPGRPDDIVQFNDRLYLFFDAEHGRSSAVGPGQQVWAYDPSGGLSFISSISPLGTIPNSTSGYQDPFQFRFDDHLYFTADADVSRNDQHEVVPGNFGLWRTDGSTAGTIPVLDLIPGFRRSLASVEVDNQLLLSVQSETGPGLWRFDGTASGTQEILAGLPTNLTVSGGLVYFTMTTPTGPGLFVSDGTAEATQLLVDLGEGIDSSPPPKLLPLQGGVVFSVEGRGLWFVDAESDAPIEISAGAVHEAVEMGGLLFFTTGAEPYRLYRSEQAESVGQVFQVFESSSLISLLGATEDTVLLRTEGETYSMKAEWSKPRRLEAPGKFQLATTDYFGFIEEEVSRELFEDDPFIPLYKDILSVQPWISDGTITQVLGDPSVDSNVGDIAVFDSVARELDGYLLLRLYSDRDFSIQSISVFAYELDSSSQLLNSVIRFRSLTPGDANRDGSVDFTDFLILSKNFGRIDATFAEGDFDASGDIDFSDFLILSNNYGQVASATAESR